MRTLLKFKIPVERGNAAFKDGSLAETIQSLIADLNPECAYFGPDDGERGGFMVFDLTDPSQIPKIAEPLFAKLDAEVDFSPIMNAEDLKRGLAG